MDKANVIVILRDLMVTLEDGKELFHEASDVTDNRDMKVLFDHYAGQRQQFLAELKEVGSTYGELEAEHSPSLQGLLRKEWLDIRTALSAKDPAAILSECEKEEGHALAAYRKAMRVPLPPDVQTMVGAQCLEIKAAHNKVRYLRDLAKAA